MAASTKIDPIQCPNCTLDSSSSRASGGQRCPNCGHPFAAEATPASGPVQPPEVLTIGGAGGAMMLIQRFWRNVLDIIFTPRKFFAGNGKALLSDQGLSTALAFAVIVNWIAAFFNFVWGSTLKVMFAQKFRDLFRIAGDVMEEKPSLLSAWDQASASVYHLVMNAGSFVLSPFITLAQVFFSAFFIHAGVKIFCKEKAEAPHRFPTTLKILSYCSAPMLFCALPGLGIVIAMFLWFVTAVAGLGAVYQTTRIRATAAALTPGFLLCAILTLFVFGLAVLGIGILKLAI